MPNDNSLHMDVDGLIEGCGPLIPPNTEGVRPLRRQVFDYIRGAGLCARIDIANSLNISPGSVTAITADLIEAGYIKEVTSPARDGEPIRGRPPVSLGVCQEAFYVAGLKLSDHKHTAVIVDFAGRVVASAEMVHNRPKRSTEDLLDEAYELLKQALAKCNLLLEQVSALGLGMPGLIDNAAGLAVWSPLIADRSVPIRDMACTKFGIPVHIDNDTNLVTLAELWFGKGRDISDFAVVTIEYGVGMGMVINHQLYRGAMGLGMEFGHTKVQLDGALCRCGQRGCVEAYVADYALVREASTALNLELKGKTAPAAVLQQLFEEAKNGNAPALSIFRRAGRYLALGLSNIINIFDPNLVILSGERMEYEFLYGDEVLAETASLTLDRMGKDPTIEIHRWGNLLWAQGAAALALSALSDGLLGHNNAQSSQYASAFLNVSVVK